MRLGTKAALFKRVVDVAIVGDTEEVDVLGRDWMHEAQHAPTAADRIEAGVAAAGRIIARAGGAVRGGPAGRGDGAADRAVVGAGPRAEQAGRVFWTRRAEDGLLGPAADLDWIIDSAALRYAVETYLVGRRLLGWQVPSTSAGCGA